MATKHYCDGCDKEIKSFDDRYGGKQIFVTVRPHAGMQAQWGLDRAFDLCDACHTRMTTLADPRRWARPEPNGAPR